MAYPVVMPKAGQSMTEGKIISWLKKEGDRVERGEPILEIETDKANLEVEAQNAGVLHKILHAAGQTCPVLTVIGVIGTPDEKINIEEVIKMAASEAGESAPAEVAPSLAPPPPPPATAAPLPPTPPAAAATPPPPTPVRAAPALVAEAPVAAPPRSGDGRIFASPLARKLARDRGVDLRRVQGTGPGGRILRKDVEHAPVGPARPAAAEFLPGMPSKPYPPPSPRPAARVPVEGMRKAIGTALQQSKQMIPHFYGNMSIDATNLMALKKAREAQGLKTSVNDFVLRACVLALQDEPRVNCRVFPDRIEYPPDVNLGVAVGTDDGLVVPVILKAQTRDLSGIAAESRRIVDAANAGKLIGMGQGTFTVSNLGMFGIESFMAIINPPEGAILAVGTITTTVVPWSGGFLPRAILKVTLSCDHRAIDGVVAARFLARLKHLIENPDRL